MTTQGRYKHKPCSGVLDLCMCPHKLHTFIYTHKSFHCWYNQSLRNTWTHKEHRYKTEAIIFWSYSLSIKYCDRTNLREPDWAPRAEGTRPCWRCSPGRTRLCGWPDTQRCLPYSSEEETDQMSFPLWMHRIALIKTFEHFCMFVYYVVYKILRNSIQ